MEKVIFSRKFVIRTYNSRASTSSFRLHEYEISLQADGEVHILQTGLDSELLLTKAGKIATVAGVPLDNRTN
jgi:hypothetical protein